MRLVLCALIANTLSAQAPADTSRRVTIGAFVDTYYAWDFGRPPARDRAFAGGALFTTQPARHDEFNVNLAFLEARLEGADARARLALQAGTSVQSNYASEPAVGGVSGAALSRHIQEAVAGVQLARDLWLDAGTFFSHIGMESWISTDNVTYTRSLVADYSPYYQSGVKLSWSRRAVQARLDVVNGWQNVSEGNGGKAVGARLDWSPKPGAAFSYYNLFSSEAGNRLRTLHGVGAKYERGRATLLAEADVGTQQRSNASGGAARWSGFTTVARARVTQRLAFAARIEGFQDANQIVLGTGSQGAVPNAPCGCRAASVGADFITPGGAMWRTELRGFRSNGAIFPDGPAASRRTGGFLTSSLALRL